MARSPTIGMALSLLREGQGEAAVAALTKAEANGDRDASLLLGQALLHGAPLTPDPAAAVVHLERAAAAPWGAPEQLLAAIHLIGYGVASDADRAWHWFAKALAVRHPPALRTAAMLRATRGDGVGAESLLSAARSAGDPSAGHALGLIAAIRGERDAARRLFGNSPLPVSARRLRALDAIGWPLDGPPWAPSSGVAPWVDAPRRGEARELSATLKVQVQDAGLSPWECDHLMTVGELELQRSHTVHPAGGDRVFADPARTSADASLRTLFPDLLVHDAAMAMAGLAGLPIERSEALTLLRYGVGQQYRRHFDFLAPGALGSARWRDQGQRVTTVIAYLADVPAGGATTFPELGIEVEARGGRLLRWDNVDADGNGDPRSLHCGEPVQAGEKWVVTAWFRERAATDYFGGQIPGRG